MAIKIDMLRCFCTVAQVGNLAEAARQLSRTQSAVSMNLKQLEDHLGKKLFKGERKSQLSILGEQIFELSLKQVRQFDQTVIDIEAMAAAAHGLLRIVSVPSMAAAVFPNVLESMTSQFPGLKVELRDADTQKVLDALINGKADIGIASGQHHLNGIESTPLFEDRFGLVCSIDHDLGQPEATPSIDDLKTNPFIRNSLCEIIQTPGFIKAIKNQDITIHNMHSLIAMVSTGKWVTVLPEKVTELTPENLVFRPISGLTDTRKIYLYVRQNVHMETIITACAACISAQLSRQ